MAFILYLSVLFLFNINICPSTRAQMSSMSRSSVFPVRTFAFTSDTSLHLDLNLVIPIPVVGNITIDIEVDLPLRVRFMNNSVAYKPIKVPYLVLPDPKPITIDLRKPDYSYNNNYYSYNQDPYSYDSSSSAYYAPEYNSPYYDSSSSSASDGQTWIDANRRNLLSSSSKKTKKLQKSGKRLPASKRTKKKGKKYTNKGGSGLQANRRSSNFTEAFQYYHRRHRRSVAESSAQHRLDLFAVFEETLNMYGLDGPACVCRAICEMAEMELLIESPVHEAIEHLLRVSRAVDTDGLLSEYNEAEKFGHESYKSKNWTACAKRYYQCPFSIFDRQPV